MEQSTGWTHWHKSETLSFFDFFLHLLGEKNKNYLEKMLNFYRNENQTLCRQCMWVSVVVQNTILNRFWNSLQISSYFKHTMSWYFQTDEHSALYNKYRFDYPKSLYNHIFAFMGHENLPNEIRWTLAVDVGCGTGQNTWPLAEHFEHVIGVDLSEDTTETSPPEPWSSQECHVQTGFSS